MVAVGRGQGPVKVQGVNEVLGPGHLTVYPSGYLNGDRAKKSSSDRAAPDQGFGIRARLMASSPTLPGRRFYDAARQLVNLAIDANDNGDYFPVS